jgi:hypothetical protein
LPKRLVCFGPVRSAKKNVSIGIPSSESDIRNGVGAFELEPRYR